MLALCLIVTFLLPSTAVAVPNVPRSYYALTDHFLRITLAAASGG